MRIEGNVTFPAGTEPDGGVPRSVAVNRMLRAGGTGGLHHFFFPQKFLQGSFYQTSEMSLGAHSDLGLPEAVRKFNMERFAGHLVELTAMFHIGKDLVLRALRTAWAHLNRLYVKRELLEVFSRPGWWQANGERLVGQMLRSLGEAEDEEDLYLDWMGPGKERLCALLNGALSRRSVIFKLGKWRTELFVKLCGVVDWRQTHEANFRRMESEWDDQRSDAMVETCASALAHVEALVLDRSPEMWDEGSRRDAMVYGAALLCVNDAEHTSDCEALLRISQAGSPNGISLKELRLSEEYEGVLRRDAALLQHKYGAAVAANDGVVARYRCMSDYGDRELTAEGAVTGSYDAVLRHGDEKRMLEIKAVREIQCAHAAQVLMYSDMYQDSLESAILWDTRHRRVLEWSLDERRRGEFARRCIKGFVENGTGNIPGVRGRVVPQTIRIVEPPDGTATSRA
jgi:hypothetical protein